MTTDFFAGCIGGGAGVIVGHPLDTVKVRLQIQSGDNIRYKGTFHALFTIIKQESISGLYRGISSPLYGVSLVNAVLFGVYGSLQPYIIGSPGNNSLWAHAIGGSIAGAAQSVICSPMELVKIRMQLNESNGKQPSSFSVFKNIYQTCGLRSGIFKGWLITISREIPGFGTYFGSYELFTQLFEKYGRLTDNDGQVGTLGMMLSGGSAGVVSWLACFPMDVIKTRFQSDTDGRYQGIADCARKTYEAEGYRVFTRTLPSLLLRAFPMSAVTFPVVTWTIRLFNEKQDHLGTSRNEIDKLLSHNQSLANNGLYKQIYDIPPYRFLTPNITTALCLHAQNFINYDNQEIKKTCTDAPIFPCYTIGHNHYLIPILEEWVELNDDTQNETGETNLASQITQVDFDSQIVILTENNVVPESEKILTNEDKVEIQEEAINPNSSFGVMIKTFFNSLLSSSYTLQKQKEDTGGTRRIE